MTPTRDLCIILLAGGVGARMGSATPKQFLQLKNKAVARHSFDLFMSLPEALEIVVVCAPQYQRLFPQINSDVRLIFALPGERRQDSVYNGLQASGSSSSLICIHDAARPCINLPLVQRVLAAGREYGAAAAGMPVKFTVKECNQEQLVAYTPNRSRLWEVQTPQVIRRDLLEQGFAHAMQHQIAVTDDVSLVELLKSPVKLVEGCHTNLKITTPEDLAHCKIIIDHL